MHVFWSNSNRFTRHFVLLSTGGEGGPQRANTTKSDHLSPSCHRSETQGAGRSIRAETANPGMAPPPRLPAGAAALLLLLAVASRAAADGNAVDVGVNWGSQLSHPLLPKSVVQMLKENGILKVKLFDADPWPVGALVDSGIEVMLGIPNDMLETMNSYGNAQDWVKENVTSYGDKLKIK